MNRPWEIYENLKEIVYVSDMDTYEIIYMNKYALKVLGYNSLNEARGKKCYKILQECLRPCGFCTNKQLKAGHFCEWNYHNKTLNKSYSLKDTMFEIDGKRYRMEIAIDKNESAEQKKVIETMLFTEAMINDGLKQALREREAERSIETFIEYIGKTTRSDRVYVFEEKEGKYVSNTFEWCAFGVTAEKENLQEVPLEVVKVWYDSFFSQKNVIIPDVEEIKEIEPQVYSYLKPQNINSLVVSPLYLGEKIIGFYGVDNPPAELLVHISDMAWITGHFIVSMITKRELVEHLEKLSYYDQLTGLRNRHALHDCITSGRVIRNVGIIYCDVMGLKKVNDQLGHVAGDNLLLRASACIKKQFRITDSYRLGGDEFLVYCGNIDEKEFYKRIEALRKDMADNSAMMALGCIWKDEVEDADMLISQADDLMYKEKQAYYAKNPK